MRVLADPDQTTLVAEEDGWLVGTLVLIVVPNLAHGGSPYAVVENLVVEESRQGRGIGKALILEAMYRARRSGAYKLSLTSNTKRAESHELYRRLGFRETHLGFEVDP
jgi:GNAT superfamily N-acetyltransferase